VGQIRFIKGYDNGLIIKVNNKQLNFNELNILDFPQLITLIPGVCTAKNPSNNLDLLFKDKLVPIGKNITVDL